MLTKNDISQIRQVIKEELDTKLKNYPTKKDMRSYPTKKDMKEDHNRLLKNIKVSVNHLDKLYLNHTERLEKIERHLDFPSPPPAF